MVMSAQMPMSEFIRQEVGAASRAGSLLHGQHWSGRPRQSVWEDPEKIENVVRFGAFWCI